MFVPIKEVGIKKYIVYKDEGYIRIYYLSKEGRIIKEKMVKNIKIISPSYNKRKERSLIICKIL